MREICNALAVGGPARSGEVKFENGREKLKQSNFRDISLADNVATQATLGEVSTMGRNRNPIAIYKVSAQGHCRLSTHKMRVDIDPRKKK